MLGHSQIQTTEGYISPPLADMQRAVNALAEEGGHIIVYRTRAERMIFLHFEETFTHVSLVNSQKGRGPNK
jgi:hypothetical protein